MKIQHSKCCDIKEQPEKKTFERVKFQERLQDKEPLEEKYATAITLVLSHFNLVPKSWTKIKITEAV